MRGVLIGKCDQSDRKRSERNVANTHCRDLPCLRRKSYVTNELDSSPTAKRSDPLLVGFSPHAVQAFNSVLSFKLRVAHLSALCNDTAIGKWHPSVPE